LSGTLLVKPGDVLTVAVGGEGGAPNGNKSPGDGGWSISPYAGGRGGSGHGLETTDGGGGGGASVIQLNGTTVVVAAGGGGEGGETIKPDNFSGGGNGGVDKGQQGNAFSLAGDVGGLGGGSSNPSLNPAGGSWTSGAPAGGGGGGGGGRYPGGGGKTSTVMGGGGGGGGASLRDALQSLSTGVASSPGTGSISVTWLPAPGSSQVYAFEKIPTTQLLEVNGAVTDYGGTVDTWQRTLGSDNKIVPNELWTYELTRTGYGQIVNNSSGKCLEVNATSGKIDQWQCVDGAGNELWKLVPSAGGGTALQIDLTGAAYGQWPAGTYYLASTVDSASVTDGTAVTLANTPSDRTAWDALPINS
jgi:Ricin-type beta-trefoil lectin domain-like